MYTVPDKIVFKVSHIFYLCVRLALYFGLFPSGAHSSAHLRWLVVWLAICLIVLSIRPPLSIRAHTQTLTHVHTCRIIRSLKQATQTHASFLCACLMMPSLLKGVNCAWAYVCALMCVFIKTVMKARSFAHSDIAMSSAISSLTPAYSPTYTRTHTHKRISLSEKFNSQCPPAGSLK